MARCSRSEKRAKTLPVELGQGGISAQRVLNPVFAVVAGDSPAVGSRLLTRPCAPAGAAWRTVSAGDLAGQSIRRAAVADGTVGRAGVRIAVGTTGGGIGGAFSIGRDGARPWSQARRRLHHRHRISTKPAGWRKRPIQDCRPRHEGPPGRHGCLAGRCLRNAWSASVSLCTPRAAAWPQPAV